MIYGKLLAGKLSDMSYREPISWNDGATEVPLDAMPTDLGPWTYNPTTRLAVAKFTPDQKQKNESKNIIDLLTDPRSAMIVALSVLARKQINVLRAAAVPSLPAITRAQFFAAWKNEIDSVET